jgi:hypothetical protein
MQGAAEAEAALFNGCTDFNACTEIVPAPFGFVRRLDCSTLKAAI